MRRPWWGRADSIVTKPPSVIRLQGMGFVPRSPMDKTRISSRHFGAVSCPAFLASGSVTCLHCASKLAIEPAPLLKVLARDANVKRKLDRSDEFDLEALGLTKAVSCFNLSEGAQGRGDQRRWPRAFDRAQTFGRAQNTGHHHRCSGKVSMGHGSPLRLRRQLSPNLGCEVVSTQ